MTYYSRSIVNDNGNKKRQQASVVTPAANRLVCDGSVENSIDNRSGAELLGAKLDKQQSLPPPPPPPQ
jgi:hypothetical protein